jgi:hypothetical protein
MAKSKPKPARPDHYVGQPITYHADRACAPMPGQVLRVHDDGHTCCLVAYCPDSGAMEERRDVPHGDTLAADADEPHFHVAGEDGTGDECE